MHCGCNPGSLFFFFLPFLKAKNNIIFNSLGKQHLMQVMFMSLTRNFDRL